MNRSLKAIENIFIEYSIAVEFKDKYDKKIDSEIRHIKSVARDIVENRSESFEGYRSTIYNLASSTRELEMNYRMRTEYATKALTIKGMANMFDDHDLLSAFNKIDGGEDFKEVWEELSQSV